ncbi:MAG: hypothetical protein ABIE70_02600 [bacterium]
MSGAAAAAAAAAAAKAKKASGAIIELSVEEFRKILARVERPVVVVAKGGFMYKKLRYMTSYKGFLFMTLADDTLGLPSGAELIWSQKIWVPS